MIYNKSDNFWEFHMDWRGFGISTCWENITIYNLGFITYCKFEDVLDK